MIVSFASAMPPSRDPASTGSATAEIITAAPRGVTIATADRPRTGGENLARGAVQLVLGVAAVQEPLLAQQLVQHAGL